MGTGISLAAVGVAVLCTLGYIVVQVIGEVAAGEAKDAVFRRPSFAMRRRRHRGLMKSGAVCALVAFMLCFLGVAVLTNGFHDDESDGQKFLMLGAVCCLAAISMLAASW